MSEALWEYLLDAAESESALWNDDNYADEFVMRLEDEE